MLTLEYIRKVARLIFQRETCISGTYHGIRIPGCGPSCSYEPPSEENILPKHNIPKGDLEKKLKK